MYTRHITLCLMIVITVDLACSGNRPTERSEPPPRLPPAVKTAPGRPQSLTAVPGKPYKGDLAKVYSCMLKNTYEHMFCKGRAGCGSVGGWSDYGRPTGVRAVDKLGVFTAGTRGFYHYGDMGRCLLAAVGRKGGGWWNMRALELLSGLSATRGRMLGRAMRYTPAIITWAAANLIPDPRDLILGTTCQRIYDATLFRTARLFAGVYGILRSKIDVEADTYRSWVANHPGQDARQYLRRTYQTQTAGLYPRDDDGTSLTGFHVAGFWLRRHLDGTERALAKALGTLLRRYDSKYLSRHPSLVSVLR